LSGVRAVFLDRLANITHAPCIEAVTEEIERVLLQTSRTP
jgi:hypothetical protein